MEWIIENSTFLGTMASLAMLVVWIVYLQLFWFSYRRQLRANVVISRGAGTGLDSLCLVSNMSAEPVLIEGMIVIAEHKGERRAAAVTNLSDTVDDGQNGRRPAREGPLKSGDYLTVGAFRDLLSLADPGAVERPGSDSLEIWIVADSSTENELVFARRRFLLADLGDRIVLRPTELETRRITRRRERREVEQILQDHLEVAVGNGW